MQCKNLHRQCVLLAQNASEIRLSAEFVGAYRYSCSCDYCGVCV